MRTETVAGGAATHWIERLRSEGYRMTDSRRALIRTLADSAQVLNAEEIHDLTTQRYPELGRATVYRTLDLFVDLGLIRRVHDEHGCHGYMAAPDDGANGLLVCESCHRVEDVPEDSLRQFAQSVLEKTGFHVGAKAVQLSGRCTDCQ